MKTFVVSEDTKITLNNGKYMLESGDKITICEGIKDWFGKKISNVLLSWCNKYLRSTYGTDNMRQVMFHYIKECDPDSADFDLLIRSVVGMSHRLQSLLKQWSSKWNVHEHVIKEDVNVMMTQIQEFLRLATYGGMGIIMIIMCIRFNITPMDATNKLVEWCRKIYEHIHKSKDIKQQKELKKRSKREIGKASADRAKRIQRTSDFAGTRDGDVGKVL